MKNHIKLLFILVGMFFSIPLTSFTQPYITINATALNFGDVIFGETYSADVVIMNIGDDVLVVNNITFSDPDFNVASTSFQVDPGSQEIITVTFDPSQIAVYEDTLTIFNNDPISPQLSAPIFANVYLPAPQYLSADENGEDVELIWGDGGGQGNWLFYGDGGINSSLGLANPGAIRIAARWPASSLVEKVGNSVGKISFVPASQFSNYTLKIWTGANADSLVYSQPATNLSIGTFNELDLTAPPLIEPATDYWFGIEIDQYVAWNFPATFDFGPAIAGFGDMINLGGDWVAASNNGWDYNWVLRIFVSGESGAEALAYPATPEEDLPVQSGELVQNPGAMFSGGKQVLNLELLGYNVYRDGEKLNTDPLTDEFYIDENVGAGAFTYGVTSVYDIGESLPIEKVVQVAGPELSLVPDFIFETVDAGITETFAIEIGNTGVAELEWQVDSLPEWISLSAVAGIIDAGGVQNLDLIINTAGLGDTIYNAVVNFQTNNFSKPVSTLPVTIDVEGNDFLMWNTTEIDFGMSPLFESKAITVEVTNLSDGLSILLPSFSILDAFEIYQQSWGLQPGEVGTFVVVFTPDETQVYEDTLYVPFFNYLDSDTLKLPLTGQGVIPPPSNLTASVVNDTVTLNWLPPGSSPDELRFGNGLPFGGIYFSDSTTYEMAAKFTPVDLMPYQDKLLEKVGFYLYDVSSANVRLKVYDDANGQNPIINLPLSNLLPNAWNDIELPFPLEISQLDTLWIGYEAEMLEFELIAGVDGGPAVNGSGNLIRTDGGDWFTLEGFIDRNWNIRGTLVDAATGESTQMLINPQNNYLKSGNVLNGYNIYKDGLKLNDEPLTENLFSDPITSGETYTYGVTSVFDYGESQPATVVVAAPANLVTPLGWEFLSTDMVHNIQIPGNVSINGFNLEQGDVIGVFYEEDGIEKCAGAAAWFGENTVVSAFGDDPEIPGKNGFGQNENMQWKVYFNQTQTTHPVDVTYNFNMPHYSGKFKMFGLSMLESLTLITVDVPDLEIKSELTVYPNPSDGIVNIRGLALPGSLRVIDLRGSTVLEQQFETPNITLDGIPKGIYIIEVKQGDSIQREKLIIR
jgi:hypothetical protein